MSSRVHAKETGGHRARCRDPVGAAFESARGGRGRVCPSVTTPASVRTICSSHAGGRSLWRGSEPLESCFAAQSPANPCCASPTRASRSTGGSRRIRSVEIVCDDMPFLVDSVTMELNRLGMTVHLIVHPVICVRRDRKGRLLKVMDSRCRRRRHRALRRSCVSTWIANPMPPIWGKSLSTCRAYSRTCAPRWKTGSRCASVCWRSSKSMEQSQPAGFRRRKPRRLWIFFAGFCTTISRSSGAAHTIFVERDGQDVMRVVPGSGLGILRDDPDSLESESFAQVPAERRAMAREKSLLVITKSTSRSTVHRPAHLDYIGIKRFDSAGEVIGEWRVLGLYSSLAYSTRPSDIPLLQAQGGPRSSDCAKFAADSHAGKALQNILDNYPRDEMFQAAEEQLSTGRQRHSRTAGTASSPIVHAHGRFRTLRDGARLCSPRSLQHRDAPAHAADSDGSAGRPAFRIQRAVLGISSRTGALHRSHPS